MNQTTPVIIDFPVDGEWITPNSPGTRVPSHGTNQFGESHAIDFVMVNKGKPYRKPVLAYLLFGLPLADFYGWNQAVRASLPGEVIQVQNDVPERNPVRIFQDLTYMARITKAFPQNPHDISPVAGNYVLVKCGPQLFALYAHLRTGSVTVKPGQMLEAGDQVGSLGHSGNSTMPHLHFQLMDSLDFGRAQGIPFLFRRYEVREGNSWRPVRASVPKQTETVRFRFA